MIPDSNLSGDLSRAANQILNSSDLTYTAYRKLEKLARQASKLQDHAQMEEISWFIEGFIVSGGETENGLLNDMP